MVVARILGLGAALGLGLALTGCGGDEESAPTGASMRTIEVVETDFALEPKSVSIDEPGTYTFRAVNRGKTAHALEIEGEGLELETEEIAPGESAELKVELEAGEYELYCPVGDHKDRGMDGTISVGGQAARTDEDQSGGRGDY